MKRIVLAIALIAVVSTVGGVYYAKVLRWKRFAVVEPGVLYRSGMLRDGQLRECIRRFGIRTVFSLTFTDNERETRTCEELGVRRYFCYLAGNGVGPDDPYLRFLEVMEDPTNHPVLVHCSAGVQRTGGSVALYRTVLQGWSIEAAINEMNAMGNDGNLPQRRQIARLSRELRGESIDERQVEALARKE